MVFDFYKDIILENDRVLLRPIEPGDAALLAEAALHDPLMLQYSPSRIHTIPLLEEYINTALLLRQNYSRYTFTVYDKTSLSWAGSTSYLNISPADDRLEIGATWYGKPYQRSGLNRHCKYLLLEYSFETLHVQRVEFRTDARNQASRTAIEKIGGMYEGTLRSHMLMPDGHRRDTVCYSMLAGEWESIKSKFPIVGYDNS